jgi:hypothetical protein
MHDQVQRRQFRFVCRAAVFSDHVSDVVMLGSLALMLTSLDPAMIGIDG